VGFTPIKSRIRARQFDCVACMMHECTLPPTETMASATCLITADFCSDTVLKYLIGCVRNFNASRKKTPVIDTVPDIMADLVNANYVHISDGWMSLSCWMHSIDGIMND